jgi:hypothetical protein
MPDYLNVLKNISEINQRQCKKNPTPIFYMYPGQILNIMKDSCVFEVAMHGKMF